MRTLVARAHSLNSTQEGGSPLHHAGMQDMSCQLSWLCYELGRATRGLGRPTVCVGHSIAAFSSGDAWGGSRAGQPAMRRTALEMRVAFVELRE